MTILLIVITAIVAILLGKHSFGKWFNHLSLYTTVWATMLFFFELKLIRYSDLSLKTWIVITTTYVIFVIGTLTPIIARSSIGKVRLEFNNSITALPAIFSDNGRTLKKLIILFSVIGILAALQHWKVLFDKYGTIENIMIEAFKIYRSRVEGDIKGVIPYVWLTSYIGLVLAGIYSAYRNKISLLSLFPLMAVLIKELANFSRAGILFGFIEFFISYLLFRHFMSKNPKIAKHNNSLKLALSFILIFTLMALGASAVKYLRHPVDDMRGSSSSLSSFKGGFLISPSIYLYASAHVAVLDKHLDREARAELFGNKTLSPFYRFLGGFDLVKKPKYHQKGYFVPQWTNTGSYLRDIHDDFGYVGVFIIPFFLGLLSTFYWFRFYENGRINDFIILVHLYLIIALSFLTMITSFPSWTIGLILLLMIFSILEKWKLMREHSTL